MTKRREPNFIEIKKTRFKLVFMHDPTITQNEIEELIKDKLKDVKYLWYVECEESVV